MQIQEYTVTQISSEIKKLVEDKYCYVRIRGEISGLKIASSGHGYFNLKDDNAILAATCWRPVLSKLKAKPTDGLEVIVTGKITTYSGQSKYQITVEHIEHAGVGALMQTFIERKNKLQAEGLFEIATKRALPFFPQCIGVVTSISGSVIQDIIHRVNARCQCRIIIWPVSVQGETSADEVAAALMGFNELSREMKPDVIIIARGGGSIEDLWSFNEEIVVRAVAASAIPTISAIGHETDFTLTDFASDMRAPTPTAAAEIATPLLSQLLSSIEDMHSKMKSILSSKVRHLEEMLKIYAILKPQSFASNLEQKIDEMGFALESAMRKTLSIIDAKMMQYRVEYPFHNMDFASLQINNASSTLKGYIVTFMDKLESKCESCSNLLSSMDYHKVLQRGFGVVKSKGKIISSVSDAKTGDTVTLELLDGTVDATIK